MDEKKLGSSLANRLKAAKAELNSIPKQEDKKPDAKLAPEKKIKQDTAELTRKISKKSTSTKNLTSPTTKNKIKLNKYKEVKAKLYISGRFDRKNNDYTTKPFYLLDNMDQEIKAYCKGSEITVYNYLLYLGLQQVKTTKTLIHADVETMEELYNNRDE